MLKNTFQKKYDVIIVGLGTAGSIALIAAAKLGLHALGIERLNAMGGIGTLGAISGYYMGSKGGLFEEINKEVLHLQKQFYTDSHAFKIDVKPYILEKFAHQYGAEFKYETIVTDVFSQNNVVTGLRCFHKGETFDLSSKFIIDCTGEADICSMCGCATTIGRAIDGQTQPFSNLLIKVEKGNAFGINQDAGYVNQNSIRDLSKKIIDNLSFQRAALEDYSKQTDYVTNASLLGIREGKTIIGEQRMTLYDFFRKEPIKNPIFYAYSNIDNHGKDTAFEDDVMKDWYAGAGLWGINFSVGVPALALIPKGYDGLLAAGRCISVDHNLSCLVRMKSDMEKCGEAAAAMVFLAIKNNVKAKDVDYETLSKMLKATGCLSEDNNVGFVNRTKTGPVAFDWMNDKEMIREALSSNAPGIAIWSAFLMKDSLTDSLIEWSRSENTNLKNYASLALGLAGKKEALPHLRNLAASRDVTVHNTSCKHTYALGVSAVYLLGKLADTESMNLLYDIINENGSFDESKFIPDELYSSVNDLKFHFISYAADSLIKIKNASPEHKKAIGTFLKKSILESGKTLPLALKAMKGLEIDAFPRIQSYVSKNLD